MGSSSSESELSDRKFIVGEHDRRSTEGYWTSRGLETLHRVYDVEELKRRMDQIDDADRFHYLTCRDKQDMTALHTAVLGDIVKVADQIIGSTDTEDRDSVINCADDHGETLLQKANSSDMAQTLLDALAPKTRREFIKHKDIFGKTVLHKAASRDRVKVADQIITSTDSEDRDSVINCVDDDGETPLHKANSSAMAQTRSEEHTSELQSRPHISYAVFCLKKKKKN